MWMAIPFTGCALMGTRDLWNGRQARWPMRQWRTGGSFFAAPRSSVSCPMTNFLWNTATLALLTFHYVFKCIWVINLDSCNSHSIIIRWVVYVPKLKFHDSWAGCELIIVYNVQCALTVLTLSIYFSSWVWEGQMIIHDIKQFTWS